MSSKRKRQNAYIQESHARFLDEHAKAVKPGKIQTTKFIKPGNVHQKQFVKSIKQNKLTIGSGPAGSGKTLLALFTGVQLMNNPDSPIEKILYIRANIDDKEEKDVGALPGDLLEKVRHLANPIIDNIEIFIDPSYVDEILLDEKITVSPFQMLRGRSFMNKFIIVDEAQNCTPKQIKTVLTRVGSGSKLVLLGDPSQCDIQLMNNGLRDFEWRYATKLQWARENNVELPMTGNIINFTKDDILRDEMTKFVLDLYEM